MEKVEKKNAARAQAGFSPLELLPPLSDFLFFDVLSSSFSPSALLIFSLWSCHSVGPFVLMCPFSFFYPLWFFFLLVCFCFSFSLFIHLCFPIPLPSLSCVASVSFSRSFLFLSHPIFLHSSFFSPPLPSSSLSPSAPSPSAFLLSLLTLSPPPFLPLPPPPISSPGPARELRHVSCPRYKSRFQLD